MDCKEESADNILLMSKQTVRDMTDKGAIIIGALVDTAANMLKSLRLLNLELPTIVNCECVAHMLNLVISDVFRCIENVTKAGAMVELFVVEVSVQSNKVEF